MITSESIKAIAPALVSAQKLIKVAVKDAKNPFFNSTYADLAEVISVCKEPLNDNGIVILQPVNGEYVETVLVHQSGEWMASQTKIVNAKPNDPQAQGLSITYARRYGLLSMLSIPTDDDDGENAMDRKESKTQKAPIKPQKPAVAPVVNQHTVTQTPHLAPEKVAEGDWRNKKPSKPQVDALIKKAVYLKQVNGLEEEARLRKEVTDWPVGIVSDFIGNKVTNLDDAREAVALMSFA